MKNMFLALALAAVPGSAALASEPVDSLSLPTGKTDWIDPVHATPPGVDYLLYPTPSRGTGTQGSCMVYVPDSCAAGSQNRFPVIYYLHGGTGNQREGRWLIERIDRAIKAGSMNPVIVVCPQALPIGWYVNANVSDSKVLSGPVEDVIVKDLIPYVDSHYPTVADASGRGIEGFSMGGRGALALAFAHPDLFGAVSSVAGAVVDWEEEPLVRALECTFGDVDDPFSKIYFDAWHPKAFACRNARSIVDSGMKVRMFVGDRDRLFNDNGVAITDRFHLLLERLSIPHSFTVVPGADHNPLEIFNDSVNAYETSFWDEAFAVKSSAMCVPGQLALFVRENVPGAGISGVRVLPDERGNHYEVILTDGGIVWFNEHFNWIKADFREAGGAFPSALVKDEIREYVIANMPRASIVLIEKVPRIGYDVMFSDGSSLVFDTSGRLIRN